MRSLVLAGLVALLVGPVGADDPTIRPATSAEASKFDDQSRRSDRSIAERYTQLRAEFEAQRAALAAFFQRGPEGGYDLRLLSWGDGSGVPASGQRLVILGIDNNGRLHVRRFDADGKLVDTDETKLPPAQAGAVAALKQRLPGLLPPHVPTRAETTQLRGDLASILRQTPQLAALQAAAMRPRDPYVDYSRRMVDLAESSPGDPAARDALLWVVDKPGHGDEGPYADQFARAAALLVRHYGDDPEAVRIGLTLDNIMTHRRDALLLGFYAAARGREAKGLARLALAQYLAKKAAEVVHARTVEGRPRQRILRGGKVIRELDLPDERYAYHLELRQCDPQVIRAEAERLFEEVISGYGDLPHVTHRDRELQASLKQPKPVLDGQPLTDESRRKIEARLARTKTLGQEAEARLDEMFNLAVGKPAPEIEGVGVDGKPLKLSHHKGKVVVLVFWGSWCGPCMQQVPYERELAARFKDRPFTVLGVDCGDAREVARKTIEKQEMTWPDWYDGEPRGGPIATLYRVRSYPSTFVLDAGGIIRLRELGGPSFDALIETLVKETEAGRHAGAQTPPAG